MVMNLNYSSGCDHTQTRNPEVVNASIDQPGPSPYQSDTQKVTLRAYIDPEGDGPDADDVQLT